MILHTEATLAKETGFAVGTLRNWRSQGKGPAFVKIGSAVRYTPEAVAEWVAVVSAPDNVTPLPQRKKESA